MTITKDELFESEGIALNWPLIVEFVAAWIEAHVDPGEPFWYQPPPYSLAQWWRKEMSQ